MKITLIAALAENRVIGRNGELPWRLPADLRHFKQRTSGHVIVMGRRTWETLDQPLPNRRTIVVTRDPDYRAEGAEVVRSIEAALKLGREAGEHELFIVGGGEIYALALPVADRMDLTFVHAEPEGDAHFPEFDAAQWTLVEDERHEPDDRHAHAFSFRCYERRRS